MARGVLIHKTLYQGKWTRSKAALYAPETFPANHLHRGFLAGEVPDVVTEEGAPTIAEIRAITRDKFRKVAGKTTSAQDGTWRIDGLNPDARYDVIMGKDTYNDLIVSDVTPVAEPLLRVKHIILTNGQHDVDIPIDVYGGEGDIDIIITDGDLPLTVTLHENHLVSSEINAPTGEYSATLEITSGRYIVAQQLTITVRNEALFIGFTGSHYGYDNEATIDPITVNVSGGRKPYAVVVDDLPLGLTYNDDEISGMVDVTSNNTQYLPVIKVTDADGVVRNYQFSISVGGDPYWSSVKTLLHFDGVVDALEPTTMYSAHIDEDAKFGVGSLAAVNGDNGMLLNEAMNADGDLTIEFWYKFDNRSSWMSYLGDWADNNNDVVMMVGETETILRVNNTEIYHSGTTRYNDGLPPHTWHHCAIVRYNGAWLMFLNGLKLFERIGLPLFNYSRGRRLLYSQTASYRLNKRQMDELRFSNMARYTDDFIPPTDPFYNFGK